MAFIYNWFGNWWERAVNTILSRHENRIQRLENHMSVLDDKLAAIDAASNTEAEAVQAIAAEVADLRAAIEAGSIPADAAARLDSIAAALSDRAAFLTTLAADPKNPVPEPTT